MKVRTPKTEKPIKQEPPVKRSGLTNYEQETIVNFNKDEDVAHVFTYQESWQRHIEKKLGILPYMTNKYGGKEYRIPKKLIPKPRVPRQPRIISEERRKELVERMAKARKAK